MGRVWKNDRAIIRQFEKEALPHLDSLFHVALGILRNQELAEDLVQETFKEALGSFHTYQQGTNCKAWIFRIFYRVRGKYFKAQNKLRTTNLDDVSESRLAVTGFQESVDARMALEVIRSLPEHYFTVMILADLEQLSYREVADAVGIPIGTVMSRLNRARRIVREKLSGQRNRAEAV